jgi:hypothetical protein
MQHCRTRLLLLAASVAFALAPAAARADTIVLKDGQKLTGKVTERPDGRLEIEQTRGARIIDRTEIESWVPDAAGGPRISKSDTIYFVDGRVLRGNVSLSDDGKEVVLTDNRGDESRFRRELVKTIIFRDGKAPPPSLVAADTAAAVVTDSDTEKRWRAQIEANLGKLRDPLTDDKERRKARGEILELGPFALNYVKTAIATTTSADALTRPVLLEVLKVAEFKEVVPAKVEEAVPGICERLIEKDVDARLKVVNEVALATPDDCAPLLLYLIKTDPEPKVKSLCVGQLSILKRYDELSEVLKMHEHGQWRLVAALELGEAGIYNGVPVLIEALKLDGVAFRDVRTIAIDKLKAWTNQGNLGYLPDSDDKEEREAAVARWESWWKAEGEEWAVKNSRSEAATVTDADKAKALDLWRDGNKVIAELQKKEEGAAATGGHIEARDVSYAYETAAYLFKQAYELDPALSSARLSRAIILYEQLGRPREAEGELKLILARFAPDDAKYLRSLANAHLARISELESNWERAERFWSEVRALDAENLDAYVGIGDSFLERALATPEGEPSVVKPAAQPKDGEGKPNETPDDLKQRRQVWLQGAVNAYKDALAAVDRKQKALRASVTDLGATTTGEIENHQTGRLIARIRDDRDSLIKRAGAIWFRLGRADSACQRAKDAAEDFKNARNFDPEDERYSKAAKLWQKIADQGGSASPQEGHP